MAPNINGSGQTWKGKQAALALFYRYCFGALALLLALSPVLRRLTAEVPFERICDFLVALMILATFVLRRFVVPRQWSLVAIATVFSMFVLAWANWQTSRPFQVTLFLLDSKILLCVVAMWVLGDKRGLSGEAARKRLAMTVYAGFVVALASFWILNAGSTQRLLLLDESNYMILALIISSVVLIDAYRIRVLSSAWIFVQAVLILAAWLAQSRTGFVSIAIVSMAMLWGANRRGLVLGIGFLALFAALLDFDRILEALTRGETTIDQIDRFVFLNELWLHWSRISLAEVLFGNNIGVYMAERSYGMHYWIARQSAEQGIPYGLAPFNFHAFFFRLPLDIGLIPAIALLSAIYYRLRRTTSTYVVAALIVSCFSMSVFYLSTIIPFIALAQLVRPLPGGRRKPVYATSQAPAFRDDPLPIH